MTQPFTLLAAWTATSTGPPAATSATSAASRRDGGRIRRGALVRADSLARLDADGWAALEAHGVRTVIDLRNDDEVGDDDAPRPASITTVRFPLDGMEDTAFWDQWMHRPEFGTPHYYGPWLERFPDRAGRVLEAIARAEPGGVAYHCVGGRDRTGLVTMLLLAFAGVPAELAAADYALSLEHVPDALLAAFYAEQGPRRPASSPRSSRASTRRSTSARRTAPPCTPA